jgi:hypothetical protein
MEENIWGGQRSSRTADSRNPSVSVVILLESIAGIIICVHRKWYNESKERTATIEHEQPLKYDMCFEHWKI